MGINNDGAKFLFAANAAGISFQHTAMLGRQNFFPDPTTLQALLDCQKVDLAADNLLSICNGYAEKLFEYFGADEVVAIDNSDYEGAGIVADLNRPLNTELRGRFSVVFDGGCLEHVFDFRRAIQNCMEMLRVGGHFLSIAPANNFCGHGFYQFSPELFFRVFSKENGFSVRAIFTKEKTRWYRVIDPQILAGRVELQNTRPTYLFVAAKKIDDRPPFVPPPQQSDYAAKWKQDYQDSPSGSRKATSFRDRIRAVLPDRIKEFLRPYAANLPIRFRFEGYEEIEEAKLLRGDF